MKRIIMMLALTALLVVALSLSALSAFAAPITCPPGQKPAKVNGQWKCVNGGGQTPPTDETKNPND